MISHPKYKELLQYLEELQQAALAFSGGVDSTFLLAAAKEALGDSVIAITIDTPYIPRWELKEAAGICKSIGIRQEIIKLKIPENIKDNPSNRCYLCKGNIFSVLVKKSEELGINTVLDGTNADDKAELRPGMRALKELGIKSPLHELGIGKDLIREWSKELGLPTWDKPAYACLLTRVPHNTTIREEELKRIEKAETFLHSIGFRAVRVRSHGDLARIELPPDKIREAMGEVAGEKISAALKELGFEYISVDITGYK